MRQNKHSYMTPDRVRRLESVGFIFDPYDTIWMEHYNELQQYKESFGDCRVSKKSKAYPKLGDWVFRQRQYFKLLKEDKPTSLNMERLKALNKIGFVWKLEAPAPKKI